MEAVEKKWDFETHRLRPVDPEFADILAQVRHYKDLPDYPNAAMADYGRALACQDEVRIWLTGIGGDDFLSGSGLHYADLIRGFSLGAIAKRLWFDYRAFRLDPTMSHPFYVLFRQGLLPNVPPRVRRMLKSIVANPLIPLPLTASFAASSGVMDRLRQQEKLPGCSTLAQQDVYRTFDSGFLAHALELNERWTAARGIEGRHPFFDRRLVEFAFAIPEEQRLRGDQTRFVMREAMRDTLPESVRTRRSKASFTHTFVSALEHLGGERLLDSPEIGELGWVDIPRLKSEYGRMLALYRRGDLGFMPLVRPIWMAFALGLWFSETFLGANRGAKQSLAAAVR
jgi:asparagine synthase (glutamine-hydrolysing)